MMPRRLPPLSALRAFEAAARHLSAKRAAEELSVTPTAISHQIRQLEENLGVALFVRRPRQLILTAQGQALLGVLSDSFDAIAETVTKLRRPPARQAVTLSTTPAVAARWLLPWVCLLRDAHPQIDLSIQVSHQAVDLDGIVADMAIRYGEGHWPGLAAEKLFDNVFIPACSPALNLREPSELVRHTLLHFSSPAPLDWAAWQRQVQVPGLDVSAGLMFSDETHGISAALDGQGIALMSRHLIAEELRSGRLVQPFGPEITVSPFHLVYPPERLEEPAIAAVREWIVGLLDPQARERACRSWVERHS
ncbi:transcriptional regulator GcvA [Franzmannia qiaohouensis]|uniref:Transcriptional regulator GcvA n=1 Tax=Franzmannia qiaohouensis TaxID=1329370 RepID=A0ABU1HG48_9GAMM|nr:transcriptional regulator GcvA [Halomonas qiaohouensis]MDR5905580.1 transcriptional regulator GcvA [Halomonas qiaohouensis]